MDNYTAYVIKTEKLSDEELDFSINRVANDLKHKFSHENKERLKDLESERRIRTKNRAKHRGFGSFPTSNAYEPNFKR